MHMYVDIWKDVFRNRNTSTAARDKVFSALDRTLPNEAKKKLGELSDNSPQAFCTIQDIIDSISSVKMNSKNNYELKYLDPIYFQNRKKSQKKNTTMCKLTLLYLVTLQ